MAHINSTMNPLFYMCLNPAFLSSFRKLKQRFFNNKTTNLDRTKTIEKDNSIQFHNYVANGKTAFMETSLN